MADYSLTLGRFALVAATAPLKEALGDGFEAVGAVLTGAEAKPRPAELALPVRGPAHRRSWQADGQRLRRQLRALLENPVVRGHGLYLAVSWDPEFSGWLMVGGGELDDENGMGPAFADWALTLSDTYRVGSMRTVKPGRRVEIYDRRTGTVPRDQLRKKYSTDFSTMSTFSLIGLPPAATDPLGRGGRALISPSVQSFAMRDGNAGLVSDAVASEAVSYTLADPSTGGGDTVALDRRGTLLLVDGGHSYPSGYGLTPTTARYPQVMTFEGVRATNYTTSIAGAILATAGGAGYNFYLQNVARGNDITGGNLLAPTNCYVHGWGQNDLPQYGPGNLEPIMEGFRRVLARSLGAATYEESDAAWTHTGGTARSSTDKNSGTGWREAATNGDKSTITVPANYVGGRIAVAFVVHGAATGTCEARVNGTLVASWSLGGTQQASSGGWNGVVRYLPAGIKAGDSLELRWASLTGSSSNYPGLDCLEFEASPTLPAVWVMNHNRLVSYSAYSGQPFPPDDNAVNAFNARLKAVVEGEYPWPVCYVDADAALNKSASLFQGDNVHPNELGHRTIARAALAALNPVEEAPGADYPLLYRTNDPPALDNGRVIVSAAGSGRFRIVAWDPTVNPSGGGWVEQGQFLIVRVGDSTGICSTIVDSRVVETSTERTVVECVLRNGSDSYSRERVFLTLERGWTGPKVEAYAAPKANGTAADLQLVYGTYDVDAYNTVVKLDASAAVQDCGAGTTLTDGNVVGASTFTGENWVYLSRAGRTFSVCAATNAAAGQARSRYMAYFYSANRNGFHIASGSAAGYLGVQFGLARNYAQLDAEAESWTLDATATAQSDAAASPGSGNSRVQSTRTADGQTVRQAALGSPGASKWRALTRAKVDSPATGSIKHAYLFATALGTTTSTSYTWVDSGTLDGAGFANQPAAVNCWRSSGASGNVYIDRILWVPLESRYTGGDYQGARDVGAMMLADTRSVPVLVTR